MKNTATLAFENASSSTSTSQLQLVKTPKRPLLPPPHLQQSESLLTQTAFLRLGPKISETLRDIGAKILRVGSMHKIFRRIFSVGEGEQLLKASRCSLFTTAGPVAGLLFISTDKLAFCSDRAIKFSSPGGDSIRFHYKVVIPLTKIMRANQSDNVKKPSDKYLQIVTNDDFEFWFMGFMNYKKTWKCLHQARSQASS
ncbi:hypothetical protein Ancab_029164 [Ancistrocladus abbreviatus]